MILTMRHIPMIWKRLRQSGMLGLGLVERMPAHFISQQMSSTTRGQLSPAYLDKHSGGQNGIF